MGGLNQRFLKSKSPWNFEHFPKIVLWSRIRQTYICQTPRIFWFLYAFQKSIKGASSNKLLDALPSLFWFPTLLCSVQSVYVAQHFCNVFQLPFTKQNMIWQYNSHKILSIWSSQPPIASKIILIPPRPSLVVSANQSDFDIVYYRFCHDNSTFQINVILFERCAL